METQEKEKIESLVKGDDVVLFMKGSRTAPQCGFSATVVQILDGYLEDYRTVDVLADPTIRQGVKDYASWPTIPQLYVKGAFVGGCDIVRELEQNGELPDLLGVERPADVEPVITLTPAAERAFLAHREGADDGAQGKMEVRLTIDAAFQHELELDGPQPGDLAVDVGAVVLRMNRATARRADGLTIEWVEGELGAGFKIDNPNEPPKVQPLSPAELKQWRDAGAPIELLDVRTEEERKTALIEGSRLLDGSSQRDLESLSRDTRLVFYCHHGSRSQAAAEHYRRLGFRDVHNLTGGIDAWSREVDPNVPRY